MLLFSLSNPCWFTVCVLISQSEPPQCSLLLLCLSLVDHVKVRADINKALCSLLRIRNRSFEEYVIKQSGLSKRLVAAVSRAFEECMKLRRTDDFVEVCCRLDGVYAAAGLVLFSFPSSLTART